MKVYYLDANAHIPMSANTLKTIKYFSGTMAGHGHPLSPNFLGQKAALALEEARDKIANLLGAESGKNIIFTSSCTQACDWALCFMCGLFSSSYPLYYSPFEHSAVRSYIEGDDDIDYYQKLMVNENGIVVPGQFKNVACMYVQNEIGTIQPLNKFKSDILFSDMCQAVGKLPIDLKNMNVSMAAFGAHKFGGPTGVGILYLKDLDMWSALEFGSRYGLDRTGTPDVVSIVATAAALEEELNSMDERLANMKAFQTTLEYELLHNGIDVIGKDAPRVLNTTFASIPKNSLSMLLELGNLGIHVGLGSACGGTLGSSAAVKALGIDEDTNFIRISQHGEYDSRDATYVAEQIISLSKLE